MKKNKISKIVGVTSLSAVMAISMAIPAAASPTYTAINGTTTTLEKYLVMKNEAEVPNATFTFEIAAGSPVAAVPGTSMEVLAGPTVSSGGTVTAPTITSSVTFAPSDTTTAEASVGTKTVKFVTPGDTSDEKFATKTLTADFTGVSFDEPGVYRYVVTENSSAQQAITNDTLRTRILDVYVTDDGTGTLQISNYALHEDATPPPSVNPNYGTNDVANAGDRLRDKSTGFTNTYATQDLYINKKVTGNQGSKDKYFKFHVVATSVQAADKFDVIMTGATAAPQQNSATIYTAATMLAANTTQIVDGKITGQQLLDGVDFYLSDTETICIQGLPKDATYTVTEVSEDYKSADYTDNVAVAGSPAVAATAWYYNGNSYPSLQEAEAAATETPGQGEITDNGIPAGADKTFSDETSDTITNHDVHTGFTNTRDGVIPTGVILAGAPFFGVAAIGAVGTGAVLIGKRNKEEDPA